LAEAGAEPDADRPSASSVVSSDGAALPRRDYIVFGSDGLKLV